MKGVPGVGLGWVGSSVTFVELPVFLPGMESGWRIIRVASVVWRVFHRWMLDPPYLFPEIGWNPRVRVIFVGWFFGFPSLMCLVFMSESSPPYLIDIFARVLLDGKIEKNEL